MEDCLLFKLENFNAQKSAILLNENMYIVVYIEIDIFWFHVEQMKRILQHESNKMKKIDCKTNFLAAFL